MTKREQTNALIARGQRQEREDRDAAYADTDGYNTQRFWQKRLAKDARDEQAQRSQKEKLAATIAADKARLEGITDAFARKITLESIAKNEELYVGME